MGERRQYGRTPAVLTRVEWGQGRDRVPPVRRSAVAPGDLLGRNGQFAAEGRRLPPGRQPEPDRRHRFHLAENVGKIFIGRLTYRILFDDKEHFSTFKLKIGPNGQSSGLPGYSIGARP